MPGYARWTSSSGAAKCPVYLAGRLSRWHLCFPKCMTARRRKPYACRRNHCIRQLWHAIPGTLVTRNVPNSDGRSPMAGVYRGVSSQHNAVRPRHSHRTLGLHPSQPHRQESPKRHRHSHHFLADLSPHQHRRSGDFPDQRHHNRGELLDKVDPHYRSPGHRHMSFETNGAAHPRAGRDGEDQQGA
nr:hypothetical protein CFP56_11311 [Quercus suber]